MPQKEYIAGEEAGLVDYLLSLGFKRTGIKQFLKYRAVSVNGKTVERHDHRLLPGDRISISSEKKALSAGVPKLGLKILFEDDAVVVIDKPEGLLTIGTEKERTKTAYFQLNEYLRERDPDKRERVFIVHRLDRETSGLIVFAKTEAAKRRLQDNWAEADKRYLAVVEGVPRKNEDTIAGYLSETATFRVYEGRGAKNAKYAVTKYKILKKGGAYSLLEIAIETGRKHQIRVHLSGIGHPVAGDMKYGAAADPLKRLALHAYRLSFPHPLTKKRLDFESRMPRVFDQLLSRTKA
ncbi:MAG: RluA family pseudouridine synthase [Nitrospirota bacterium]|nr:RluA family pseudouridine synthase [Nitrospirota bacterium]